MSGPASSLILPVEPYEVSGYTFGQRVRSRKILWARHLGDDIVVSENTKVVCIGDGKVIWSEVRGGTKEKHNWGGVVIVEHVNPATGLLFYSIYGHLKDLTVAQGDDVSLGALIGVVAGGNTPENGYWKLAHLHFGIYTGPWMHKVLPGYARPFEGRTKFSWWENPRPFIQSYTQVPLNPSS
jgi:murein DD-endopeptidase MepM/ murein hydrolase activator NlpD